MKHTDKCQVDTYNRLLDEVTRQLADIHATYTSVETVKQINISYPTVKRITADVKTTTQSTIPAMEMIFASAQEHVKKLLATDIYPRFVKHQVTASATVALSDNKARFQGLGDCFCLTDPS
jgi:phototropin